MTLESSEAVSDELTGLATPSCLYCGAALTGRQRRFCSRNHRGDYRKNGYRPRTRVHRKGAGPWRWELKPKITESCAVCGGSMVGKRSDALWCSRPCRDRGRGLGTHEGRAKRHGADYEPGIDWQKLYAEDGPACYLCGIDVDLADFTTDGTRWIAGLMYPSLDHVVPLSKGGHHVRTNCRLAHVHCNAKKGNRS